MYVVFEVEKANARKADDVFKDDIVSRQSIVVRESKVMDIKELQGKDVQLILIEGASQEALDRAKKLFEGIGKPLADAVAAAVHKKIHEQDEAAADGMGALFG